MALTRRARDLVLIAVLLALPLLVLRANLKSPSQLNLIDRAVLRLAAPLQGVITWAARGIGGAWSRYVSLVRVQHDNERLRDENGQLRLKLARAVEEASRGAELQRLLGLRAELPAETLSAEVVGVETSSLFRVVRLRIDRGVGEVKPGMPVLAPAGVVGRIERVFGGYADVLLAVDPKSSVDIVVQRTGGRGVIKGILGDNRYRMRIEYLLRKDEVSEGDAVVTSGLGGAFPRGIPVGRVVRVNRRDFGLYQEAEVEPAVHFAKLDEVLVVLQPPPPPDPDAGKHAEATHGLVVPR